jgi:hypothetical protein
MDGPKLPKYNLARRTILSHYNRPLWSAPNCPYITLPGLLYLFITMDRFAGPQTALTIALPVSLY